jgi:hypothetical protein
MTSPLSWLIGLGHAQLMQNVLHQAPLGKRRLQQVGPDKSGEEVPPGAVEIAQEQGQQNKAAGNGPDIAFHGHGDPPIEHMIHS